MNTTAHMDSAGFVAGLAPAPRYPIQLDPRQPVFSPAVRFAPKELSLTQAIRLVAYWATMIGITLVMGRSGFSYLRQVQSERPAQHSVR
jgi:hypothetical protein